MSPDDSGAELSESINRVPKPETSRSDFWVEDPEELPDDGKLFWCPDCGHVFDRHGQHSGDKFCVNCEWRHGTLVPMNPVGPNAENYFNDVAADGGQQIDWPPELDRTPPEERTEYPGGFRVSRSVAFQNVLDELAAWDGVTDVQLDTAAQHLKRDPNKPYANANPDDPSVVVRFQKDGEDMAAGCDRWDNLRDNGQDLYHYLHETRMQEQRGTVTAESEYEKLRLPSGDEDVAVGEPPAYVVLGVDPEATDAEVKQAYRERVKEVHPDNGGSPEAFERVQNAREAMLS